MKSLAIVILLALQVAYSFDFGKYTVIDEETKNFLRTNRESIPPDSAFTPGVLSLFGNSLTIENDFWSIIPESKLGVVPGTIDSTYLGDYKCADYGRTLWEADHCFNAAVTSVKPEVLIIMFGTNESLGASSNEVWDEWRDYYAAQLDSLLSVGIIPIVSTIPPVADVFDSTDIAVDSVSPGINQALRTMAENKHVVLVDYHQALLDYTGGKPFETKWWDDTFVHPSGGCEPDTSEPACGYGIRNAVTWQAVNKVYRIIIDNGLPDTGKTYTVSAENGRAGPLRPGGAFSAATIPGSSNIKLSFSRQHKPRFVRLLTLKGKPLSMQVSLNETDATVSVENAQAGLYVIEASIKGKLHRRRVLLIPE